MVGRRPGTDQVESSPAIGAVMRAVAVWRRQKGAEPAPLGATEALDLDPRFGAANDRAQRDGDYVEQGVAFGSVHSRVGQVGEVSADGARSKQIQGKPQRSNQRIGARQYPRLPPRLSS